MMLMLLIDYIVQYNITTYFSDDMDRRQHDYFRRRDEGWPAIGGGRKLLTATQFMQDFYASADLVQKAIRMSLSPFALIENVINVTAVMTFAWWDQRHTHRYEEPRLDHLRSKYDKISEDKKVLLSMSRRAFGIAVCSLYHQTGCLRVERTLGSSPCA